MFNDKKGWHILSKSQVCNTFNDGLSAIMLFTIKKNVIIIIARC